MEVQKQGKAEESGTKQRERQENKREKGLHNSIKEKKLQRVLHNFHRVFHMDENVGNKEVWGTITEKGNCETPRNENKNIVFSRHNIEREGKGKRRPPLRKNCGAAVCLIHHRMRRAVVNTRV